jgi:D-alanyl-lipoteichoic acid acyltransferase DltB (MBOAT superfamily)
MVFNSGIFIAFLGIVLPLYFLLRKHLAAQNLLLLLASYVFYGWWDYRFLGLILLSSVVDYGCAIKIHASQSARQRRFYLTCSILVNLGILALFKYANFFSASLTDLLRSFSLEPSFPLLHIILPVGISFYTFQTMSYTVDVYQRKLSPERHFPTFCLYVCYFPQLVAGPIERAQRLLPQLRKRRDIDWDQIESGALLMLMGFVKKIAVADFLAPSVNYIFADPGSASPTGLLIGVYMFALQIYADFSGYSNIARGISRILGIDLMQNFRLPYLSASFSEFWRRWHISLSEWLRDYLYIPLGGNRHGRVRMFRNLILTMLLGGLWHGAHWRFVTWGALHGLFLCGERLVGTLGAALPTWTRRLTRPLMILAVFHLTCLGWIYFRATDLHQAWEIISTIARGPLVLPINPGSGLLTIRFAILVLASAALFLAETPQLLAKHEDGVTDWNPWLRGAWVGAAVCLLMLLGDAADVPFIYFQF